MILKNYFSEYICRYHSHIFETDQGIIVVKYFMSSVMNIESSVEITLLRRIFVVVRLAVSVEVMSG